MERAKSRMLLIAGLFIVLLLLLILGIACLVWGRPSFEVKGFSWN